MKRAITTAVVFILLMLIIGQCVTIGVMAFMSTGQQAGQESAEFYRGMYYLCWDAYQGSGYSEADVIEACNAHVQKERDLKVHLSDTPGYKP